MLFIKYLTWYNSFHLSTQVKSFLKLFVSLSEVSWDHPRATASGRLFLWAVRVSSVFRYTGNQLITPTLQSAHCYCNKMHQRHAMEQDVLLNCISCIYGWTLFESYIIIALVQRYIKHFLGESSFHKLPEQGELAHSVKPGSHLRIVGHGAAWGKKVHDSWKIGTIQGTIQEAAKIDQVSLKCSEICGDQEWPWIYE